MAPRTRAAQRTTEVLNEEAANTSHPPTPRVEQRERPPLGELSIAENEHTPIVIDVNLKSKKPSRKKRNNKENIRKPEVVEDEYESSSSSAVEEARQELRCINHNFVPPYLDSRPQTPPSRAVKAARRKLSPASVKTPRFDPAIHTLPPSAKRNIPDDSFVAVLEARSPTKKKSEAIITEEGMEDNLVAIESLAVARTPTYARSTSTSPIRSPRIEDSVQAIDALAEALEELESSLPVVVEDTKAVSFKAASVSPSKPIANTTKKRVASAPIRKKPIAPSNQSRSVPATTKKASTTKTEATRVSAGTKTGPRPSLSVAKTMSKPVTKPLVTPKTPIPRVASISKAPFIPAKSTKTPTRSAFSLPSEAITAKKKAAHEAKLKQEEEAKKAKREFKARPVPTRMSSGAATTPRPTVTSQKRKSLAKGDVSVTKQTPGTAKAVVKPPKLATTAGNRPTPAKLNPRVPAAALKSTLVNKTKPTPKAEQIRTAPTINEPARPLPAKSTTKNASTTVTKNVRVIATKSAAETNPKPKSRVSTISPRVTPTKWITDRQKAEAAKKARAEAAERGRQASREWAEKELKRRQQLAAANAKDK